MNTTYRSLAALEYLRNSLQENLEIVDGSSSKLSQIMEGIISTLRGREKVKIVININLISAEGGGVKVFHTIKT